MYFKSIMAISRKIQKNDNFSNDKSFDNENDLENIENQSF